MNYQYSHDKVDNITEKATEHGDYAYNYDDLYRLADVDNPDFDDEAFTYDGVGNRLTAEDVAGNWSYSTNNELTGYDDVSYVYDANGNTTNKTNGTNVTKYIYNTEDRLSEVRDGNDVLIASYYYDPFGRRLWKEVSGTRTYFHYADEGLIGKYDSTGAEIKTYGYKPGSTWTTDPLFMKEGSSYYFYHTDHLGTPQKITAVNGAVVWSAKYSSFGEATVDAASSVTNNLRFAGQYFDSETDTHYNYHRHYNPKTGRYLTPDPIGFNGGINFYNYTENSPLIHIDPYGLAVLAKCTYVSVSAGAAYGRLECDLEGECIDGKRQVAKYAADLIGISLGAPAGGTYFTLFDEDISDVRELQGSASINIVSMAFGVGVSGGEICMGNRCFSSEMGPQLGIDFSIDLMESIGDGQVTEIRTICCDSE